MHFEQFYLGCLAQASYMLASRGDAVVVDPQRDVDIYLQAAAKQKLQIRHIFETHLHADFVSGHKELADRTGAAIYIGPNSRATVRHVQVRDGFELAVGTLRITTLETPGHTPESICLLVTDEEQSPEPWAVLTGDTLFVGDVGRPDLSKIYQPEALAGMLYDSLHGKLLKLPDGVIVYPGHGAGSLCGRSLGNARFSTIRMERLTNYAIQINTKEEFIQQLTTNLPPRPEYFSQAAQINRSGAPSLAHLPRLKPISATILKSLLDRGGVALDVRGGNEFAASHVPGSINIPLSGQFAPWAGALLGLSSQPVLVADSPEQLDESRVRLARIGIDDLGGYLEGGVEGWTRDGLALEVLQQISVQNLSDLLQRRSVRVLDVRRLPECRQGHIDSATTWALDQFRTSLPDIDRGEPIAIICQGGYRSAIASSFLMRAGFRSISNVRGGFDAWRNAGFPWVGEEATAVLTA